MPNTIAAHTKNNQYPIQVPKISLCFIIKTTSNKLKSSGSFVWSGQPDGLHTHRSPKWSDRVAGVVRSKPRSNTICSIIGKI